MDFVSIIRMFIHAERPGNFELNISSPEGNSISNHPGHGTLTSQILLIFSSFVDSVEMMNPQKFQPSTPYGSEVIEI